MGPWNLPRRVGGLRLSRSEARPLRRQLEDRVQLNNYNRRLSDGHQRTYTCFIGEDEPRFYEACEPRPRFAEVRCASFRA